MEQQSQQQYEGAILTQLIKNAERLAVIESDLSQLKKDYGTAKWLLVTIAIGVLINLISQPILKWLV